jgi:CHAT domain-containing protein
MAVYYLLHHQLISRGDFAGLVDETIAAVGDRTPNPAAVRDFLEAAHNYCIWQAGDIMAEGGDPAAWLTLGERLLAVTGDESLGLNLGPRLTGMRARQLDLAGDAQRAADAYAEYLTASPPGSRKGMWSALSEATLRLQTGEYQRVLDRLEPMAEGLLDWYLTAVIDADIGDAGLAHGRAVALMASALTHLGRLDDAVGLIDTAKSARLRYRVSLQQHPSRARVLELERALLEVSRSVPGQESAEEQGLLLRAQLLEQYRRLRPDLGEQIGRVRSVTEMSAVLEPDEAVVSLAAFDDLTTVTLITPAGSLFTMRLSAWPWSRWDALLDGPGGWRRFLAGRTAPGGEEEENQQVSGPDALDILIRAADRVLGESIGELIEHAAEGIRKVIVVPHRWLHLIPYWALPSLAELPVRIFSSVSELVTSRTDPAPPAPARQCLVVTNPTGDLLCSASEAESVVGTMMPAEQLSGREANAGAIAAALSSADFFHYSGHAHSDHADPDRSALLVALSADQTLNPFPDWAVAAGPWQPAADGWRTGQVPGAGLLSTRAGPDRQMELRMERGAAPTLYARYAGGRLRQLGELWSVGDILALGRESPCQLAFLSACQAGVAGGKSAYIDEYGGLPAALRLGGVASVVCSLWEVDEGFTALYTDLFYARMPAGHADPVMVVRRVGRDLREARKPDVLQRLDRLADQVRARSPRTALALEGYRAKIEAERGDLPYARPWEWASFYAIGGGVLDLTAPAERKGA